MRCIISKALLVLNVVLLTAPMASASVIDNTVEACRITRFCNVLDGVEPGTSVRDLMKGNHCFKEKVNGCFLTTAIAGVTLKKNDSDLTRSILYGNFCGWRNLATNPDGSRVNWKNLQEAVVAMNHLQSVDEIDEACKQHDIEYHTAPFPICEADVRLIEKLKKIAWDQPNSYSVSQREMALAMAGAMQKNKSTCKAIQRLKQLNLW